MKLYLHICRYANLGCWDFNTIPDDICLEVIPNRNEMKLKSINEKH